MTPVTSWMKKHVDILAIIGVVLVVMVFFYKTGLHGLLPVPTDDLVGMYHPWRDAYAHTFTNGVPFKNFLITDPIRQQIPWRKQVVQALGLGKLPLWDATAFSGTPLLGNIQSGALYPLNFLFFLFPFDIAWTILIISQPLLAGLFMYLFLRSKKLESLAAFVGSVVFAFSGFSISWLTWGTIGSTIAWLPLILLSFDKIHSSAKKWPWQVVFVIAVVSSFFAGHLQVFFYGMLLFVLYAVSIKKGGTKLKLYPMHILIPIIIAALTAPVLVRFISEFMTSSRVSGASWTAEGFFIPVQHLIQFIAPDYFGNPTTLNYWGTWNYGEMIGYVGIIGLIVACVGIGRSTLFWAISAVVALVFAVDSQVSHLPFLWHIPFLSSLQPTRLLALVDFCLAVLSAYGVSSMIRNEKKIPRIAVTLGVGCIVALCWLSVYQPAWFHIPLEQVGIIKRNMILPTALFGAWCVVCVSSFMRSSFLRTVGYMGMIVVLLFDLTRFGWKFTPFTDRSYFFPKTEIIEQLQQMKKPFRVTAVDDRLMPPNVFGYYDIESIAGYDPVYSGRYEEYIAAMERGEPNITPPFGFNRIIAPKSISSPLFSLLGVSYILSINPIDSSDVKLLSEEGTTKLYTVTKKIPRVYFATNVVVEKDKQAVMNRLYDSSFVPGQTAIIEGDLDVAPSHTGDGKAVIISYTGDRIQLETTTASTQYLVIGNIMDLNWHVTVDGKETTVFRTNYIFFGTLVPAGIHQITVQYR